MKRLYGYTLVFGLCLAIFSFVVCFATPADVLIASALSRSPDGWNITLNDTLNERLSKYDVKRELTASLSARVGTEKNLRLSLFVVGSILSAFSALGLIREKKFAGATLKIS